VSIIDYRKTGEFLILRSLFAVYEDETSDVTNDKLLSLTVHYVENVTGQM